MWSARITTKGQEQLVTALREHRQADLAELLGCAQCTISAWVRGALRPAPRNREAVRDALGIAPESWDEELVKPFVVTVPGFFGYRAAEPAEQFRGSK